ncbi:unnamed protein product [Withania somnifera]
MLPLLRMKSLFSPLLSRPNIIPLSLCFHFQEPIFVCRRYGVLSTFKNPSYVQTLNPMSKVSYFRCCTVQNYNQVRVLNSEASGSGSGELHVVVGPMFAGKTTTLLKRIKSERSNGRSVAIIKSDKDTRYGLDSIVTHDGDRLRSFSSVLDIIPIADSVTKLTARCELYGKRASFTLRKTEETKTELIAGAEAYMPVCRKHYVSGKVVKEAARSVLKSQNVECCSIL